SRLGTDSVTKKIAEVIIFKTLLNLVRINLTLIVEVQVTVARLVFTVTLLPNWNVRNFTTLRNFNHRLLPHVKELNLRLNCLWGLRQSGELLSGVRLTHFTDSILQKSFVSFIEPFTQLTHTLNVLFSTFRGWFL